MTERGGWLGVAILMAAVIVGVAILMRAYGVLPT
jgi:hypothetical protein